MIIYFNAEPKQRDGDGWVLQYDTETGKVKEDTRGIRRDERFELLPNADIDEIRMAARSSGFDIAPYIIPMVIKKKGETK